MDVSIIITTHSEPKTLAKVLIRIFKDLKSNFWQNKNVEVLVVGPDKLTRKIFKKFLKKQGCINRMFQFKLLKDKGAGKPRALNFARAKAKGNVLIFTDGDVLLKPGSMVKLFKPFQNREVGLVSGQPISLNSKKNMFGFWSKYLVNEAHKLRKKNAKRQNYFPASGYLYAVKKKLFPKLPENILAEDAWVSWQVFQKGYKLIYKPTAKVLIKFPKNWSDWIKQKKRSVGGYVQKQDKQNRFAKELKGGLKSIWSYPQNTQEYWWMILLILARIYLWLIILINIKLLKKYNWERIASTK